MKLFTRRSARSRDERGVIAPIIGILFASSIVTTMLALSIDVGNITWERRQLQNGADSAAMALALKCAQNKVNCNPVTDVTDLKSLLNANAADGRAQFNNSRSGTVNGQCGRATGNAVMPACTSPATFGNLRDCPPLAGWLAADPNIPYVETYTRTETKTGSTILPKFFAQTVTGNRNSSVGACARAAWGLPGGVSRPVPIMVSVCEWQSYTGATLLYANPPVGSWPGYGGAGQPAWPTAEARINLHTDGQTGCTWDGKDRPGGFGYAQSVSCSAVVTNGNWVKVDTGNSATNSCRDAIAAARGTMILLPIFDCVISSGSAPTSPPSSGTNCVSGTGSNTWYHIQGWGAFYLAGYKIGGSDQAVSLRTGSLPCNGNQRCLSGWFTKAILDSDTLSAPGGNTDFGVVSIKLAG